MKESTFRIWLKGITPAEIWQGFQDLNLTPYNDVWLFSGAIRNYWLGYRDPADIKDLDWVVQNRQPLPFYKDSSTPAESNAFGGTKVTVNGISNDIWFLNDSWAFRKIKEMRPVQPSEHNINNLLKTVMFNSQAIAYSLATDQFVVDEKFLEFIQTRTLDIVWATNPAKEQRARDAIRLMHKYHLTWSDRLTKFVAENSDASTEVLDSNS
jgi:hypothetical protein